MSTYTKKTGACWDGCHLVVSNCIHLVKIYGGTTNWYCYWRLLKKVSLTWLSRIYLLLLSIYTFILGCKWQLPPCNYIPKVYYPIWTSNTRGYYLRVIPSYRGINIHGYDYITCLTSVRIPLMLSDKRIPRLFGITFFDPFLELLGSEFLQYTHMVKPWEVWLLH